MLSRNEASFIRSKFLVSFDICEVVVKGNLYLAAWFSNQGADFNNYFTEGLKITTPYGVVVADGFWNSYFGKKGDEHIRFVGPSNALSAIFYPHENSDLFKEGECKTEK